MTDDKWIMIKTKHYMGAVSVNEDDVVVKATISVLNAEGKKLEDFLQGLRDDDTLVDYCLLANPERDKGTTNSSVTKPLNTSKPIHVREGE